MIKSFADKKTEELFLRRSMIKGLPSDIQRTALRKLAQLHTAITSEELKVPPGNHFEYLKGDRDGQCSIRINNQWRICFMWQNGDAFKVEIVDYHK